MCNPRLEEVKCAIVFIIQVRLISFSRRKLGISQKLIANFFQSSRLAFYQFFLRKPEFSVQFSNLFLYQCSYIKIRQREGFCVWVNGNSQNSQNNDQPLLPNYGYPRWSVNEGSCQTIAADII